MKTCSNCNIQKDFSCFSKCASKKDGLYPLCKECYSAYNKEYRAKNKEIIKLRKKEYEQNNKHEIAIKNKKYREENKERINKQRQEYRRKNTLRERERASRWKKNNRDKFNQHEKDRRDKKHTKVNYEDVLERDGMWCYLGGHVIKGRYEIDHIEPLSRGGKHTEDNLSVTCPLHNGQKYNKSLLEYLLYVK